MRRAAVLALVLALPVATGADELRIVPLVRGEYVLVSFEMSDGYSGEVRDAIRSGLKTTFTYTVDLRTPVALWLDRTIASAVVSTSIEYDNLTRRYKMVRTLDGRVEEAVVTGDEQHVREFVTRFERLPLFRTAALEPNREYYLRIRADVRPRNGAFLWPWGNGRSAQAKFTFIP